MFRILVTGSRDWEDWRTVYMALNAVCDEFDLWHTPSQEYGRLIPDPGKVSVLHGACPTGADEWADGWCIANLLEAQRYPAKWRVLGKKAGFIRNEQMVNTYPDLVLAFWKNKSKGTGHTIDLAEDRGIPVRIWTDDAGA